MYVILDFLWVTMGTYFYFVTNHGTRCLKQLSLAIPVWKLTNICKYANKSCDMCTYYLLCRYNSQYDMYA